MVRSETASSVLGAGDHHEQQDHGCPHRQADEGNVVLEHLTRCHRQRQDHTAEHGDAASHREFLAKLGHHGGLCAHADEQQHHGQREGIAAVVDVLGVDVVEQWAELGHEHQPDAHGAGNVHRPAAFRGAKTTVLPQVAAHIAVEQEQHQIQPRIHHKVGGDHDEVACFPGVPCTNQAAASQHSSAAAESSIQIIQLRFSRL